MYKKASYLLIMLLIGAMDYARDNRKASQNPKVPFDVNEVINRVSPYGSLTPNSSSLSPELTGEFLIDTNITYIPTRGSKYQPSIAFDGTNYLVVWVDLRIGRFQIYGTRVSQTGVILDPAGFTISTTGNSPSVAFVGTNYLVVWNDERNGNCDIYGTRVTQAGVVLEPNGIAISVRPDYQACPAVAFDGSNFLVVWEDNRSGPSEDDIYGTLVNQAGVVLDTIGVAISTAPQRQTEPSVAFDGSNYLVVWNDLRHHHGNIYYSNIYGTRVTQSIKVFDTLGIAISDTSEGGAVSSIVFGDSNYLVVGNVAPPSRSDGNVSGARITPSGTILDPDGFAISTVANDQYSPSVAFDGINYLLVWTDFREISETPFNYGIYETRISQSGVVLDPTGINISDYAWHWANPSVAFDGINYLVVWADGRNGSGYSDIYGARVSQAGTVLDPNGIAISTAPYDQAVPKITFDGTNYLVVWQDRRFEPVINIDIHGTRINQSGLVLDPEGIPISTAAHYQLLPSVAFDGINYLVVWTDTRIGSEIYCTRVSQAGTILDPDGILIAKASFLSDASVAFDGVNYFVVWGDYDRDEIYVTRINPAGQFLDTIIAITNDTNWQGEACISFDGTNYLLIWTDNRNDPLNCDLYGAKVSPFGRVLDTFAVSLQPRFLSSAAIAHGEGNQIFITFMGWTEFINGNPANTYRIWGKFYPFVRIAEENSKVKMPSAKLLEVYPNPARLYLAIRLPQSADRKIIKMFDVTGKMIREIASATMLPRNDNVVKISLKGIKPGIYFLQVGKVTKKFLVVK